MKTKINYLTNNKIFVKLLSTHVTFQTPHVVLMSFMIGLIYFFKNFSLKETSKKTTVYQYQCFAIEIPQAYANPRKVL